MRMTNKRTGQSVLEYTIIIAVVAAAILAMSQYIKRAVYANLKIIQDQVNVEAIK
jgi:Flp pilus assembly pilin Flp